MPSFSDMPFSFNSDGISGTISVDVDFEVFCERCGAGICNNATTRKSHNRLYPQVCIEPCEKCIESAKKETEEEMQRKIDALELTIENLEETVDSLNGKVDELETKQEELQ